MDSRPVFVLLTATTCGACRIFKRKTWPSLKKALEEKGEVQIVEIEVLDPGSKPDLIKYHKQLYRFIGWFPTMSLYPAERWFNHSSELIGIVKNGKIVPPGKNDEGSIVPEHIEPVGKIILSEEDIIKWIDFTLKNKDGMFVRLNNSNNSYKNSNNIIKNTATIKNTTIKNTTIKNTATKNTTIKNTDDDKIMVTNNGRPIKRFPDGKFMVPTAGYYAKFEPSKVK